VRTVPRDGWFRSAKEEMIFIVEDPDDSGDSYEISCVAIGKDGEDKSEDQESEDQDSDF
jgi:hypothetical protein